MQAATMGVGVDFARLAARRAVRRRWGRLAYVAATVLAVSLDGEVAGSLRVVTAGT